MSVKILYLLFLLDMFGMALVFTLTNPHVLNLGGTLSLGGLLLSLSSGAQLFAGPVIGSWSDTRGRKILLLSTLSIVFLSDALSGVSSLAVFFLARLLYGFAHQTDPLIRALIADTVPKEQLTNTFNNLMVIIGLAFIMGPIFGGMLYEIFHSFRYISILLCTLDIATISITLFCIEEKSKTRKADDETQKKPFLQSIYSDLSKVFVDLKNVNWSKYGDLLEIKFFLEAAFMMLYVDMAVILMQKFLYSQTQLGFAMAYTSINMIVSTFLSSFIIKNVYKADQTGFQRIFHGFIAVTISFFALHFAYTSVLYLLVFVPALIAKALLDSTWMEILTSKTTESDKGVMMGAATSMISLAGLVCPLISGFVGDFIGVDALIMLPVIPSLLGTILVRKVKSRVTDVSKND